jgi:hypothetical protein
MAVKYAVANGNWNAGTTWNDGTIPQSDDDVYANGYTITINISTLVVGSINTIVNEEYGIAQGGTFTCSIPTNILTSRTCDLRFVSGNVSINYTGNTNKNCYFTAPLIKSYSNGLVGHPNGNGTGWIITANIEISNTNESLGYAGSGISRHILIINGNIMSTNGFFYSYFSTSNTGGWTIMINGNMYGGHEGSLNQGLSYVEINGHKHYCMNEGDKFLQGGMTISGSVTYESNNGSVGLDLSSTNILNHDTFTLKDVTQPQRVNPFIIVTDAEMNNRQQYPPEDEVKQGTEYVWGEKVGTYNPDYPPESVVLKDYEYGDSDDRKTGTMENEVIVEVDNTNTINVFPHNRRNNG